MALIPDCQALILGFMGRAHVQKTIRIDAPIEFVFERLVDHEAMAQWPGIGASTLTVEGTPDRNGLGATRKIRALGWTLLEDVVHFEAPVGYDYVITKGLPVNHRGRVRLEQKGASVELVWQVSIESSWPLLSEVVIRLLGQGLPGALQFFKDDVEKRHRAMR